MSRRVTLDHPELGSRVRLQNTTTNRPTARVHQTQSVSAMSKRAHRARGDVARQTSVAQKPTTSNSAPQTPTAKARSLEHTQTYSDHYNDNRSGSIVSKWKVNSIYAMASMLFLVGMFVAINGFVSTTKANEQISAIDNVINSGDGQAVQRLADSIPNEDGVSDADIANYRVEPDKPRYIRIPSINLSTTRVLETGLTSDGAVETPEGIYDTSWYRGSASLMSQTGAMFIVGHYVGPNKAGVFFHLEDVKIGNIVEIEHGNGDLSHFRIVEKQDFPVNNVDMVKALSPVDSDKLGLNLMTCGGKWVASQQQYDRRTLVRTEKI